MPFGLILLRNGMLFDVIKEKNMYGKTVMGIERSSFIFHQSQLVKEYRKVKAAGHAEQLLLDLKALQSAE